MPLSAVPAATVRPWQRRISGPSRGHRGTESVPAPPACATRHSRPACKAEHAPAPDPPNGDGPAEPRIHRCGTPKGTLNTARTFVRCDRFVRVHNAPPQARAHDIEPVKRRFGRDAPPPPPFRRHEKPSPWTVTVKCFPILRLSRALSRRRVIATTPSGAACPVGWPTPPCGYPLRSPPKAPRACACAPRPTTGSSRRGTLPRIEFPACHLRQVPFIEQRGAKRSVLHQRADGRGPQGAEPVEAGELDLLFDPGLGQHPAITDNDHTPQAGAIPRPPDDGLHCRRVRGVAVEHPARDRPAGPVTEQAEFDLQLALPAMPGVAVGGQRATPPPPSRLMSDPTAQGIHRQDAPGPAGFRFAPAGPPANPLPCTVRRRRRGRAQAYPQVSVAVSGESPWAVASFAFGPGMRATIMATARSRLRDPRWAMMRPGPGFPKVPRAAATWPCGNGLSISKASGRSRTTLPCSQARNSPLSPAGNPERLARVRLRDFPAFLSHQDSRSKTAGGEFRFGMVSIYIDWCIRSTPRIVKG